MAFPPRQPRGTFNPRFKKEQQQEHRTNHMIKVPEVRLVGENLDYERSVEIKLQQYVLRFALILQLIYSTVESESKNQVNIFSIKGAIQLFDYFYNNAIQVRTEILKKNYFETLTELQKNILNELPKTFTTAEGLKIACKLIEGKPRVSDRQFKTYLKDVKLFKRLAHGSYEKIV